MIDGYKGEISECNLTKGKGCPVCYGRTTLKGINDLWTTNPEIAKLLANPEDGYKYSKGSNKRVDWKCPECGNIIKYNKINNITHRGLSCPKCSDGISYPEKFMYNLLQQLNVNFDYQYSPKWCKYQINGKIKQGRYDFYISNKKIIVEMDGGIGHGNNCKLNKYSVKKSIDIDKVKDIIAQEHGIKVIRIDCDYKDDRFQYIRNSIIHNYDFTTIFNIAILDWKPIDRVAQKSIVKMVCKLHNEYPNKTPKEIGKIVNLDNSTIRRYLVKGTNLGWCTYIPHH